MNWTNRGSNPGMHSKFFSSPKGPGRHWGRSVKLTTRLHTASMLKSSGAVPALPLGAFMALTGKTSPVFFYFFFLFSTCRIFKKVVFYFIHKFCVNKHITKQNHSVSRERCELLCKVLLRQLATFTLFRNVPNMSVFHATHTPYTHSEICTACPKISAPMFFSVCTYFSFQIRDN